GGSFLVNALVTGIILWLGFTAARVVVHDGFDPRGFRVTPYTLLNGLVTVLAMALVIGLLPPAWGDADGAAGAAEGGRPVTPAVLASLPLVVVSVLLALRVAPLRAAGAGIVLVVVLVLTAFDDRAGDLVPGLVSWLPTAVEVLAIIGGGIALARIMIL